MGLLEQLKGSLAAVIFGLIFIACAVGGTWWNEGRTIKTHKGLEQGAKGVYSSQNNAYVSPENEGKLLHVSGTVTTSEVLKDTDFGIEVPHLKLKRNVEMYQWREEKDTKKNENSEEKITTFRYKKVWSEPLINSQNFHEASTHQNPSSKKYASFSKTVSSAQLGAHDLNSNQISRLTNWGSFKFSEITPVPDASILNSEGKPTEIYIGKTSIENPQVGDLKISYKAVYEGDYSLIAQQWGNTFQPFITDRGTEIDFLKSGIHPAESMFQEEISGNNFLKWMLRLAGFVFMFLGIRMLFSLITLFTNQVPILGSIVNFGISLFSGIVAFCVFCVVAGVAWVFYRPVIGITLLVAGLGTLFFFSEKGKKLKTNIHKTLHKNSSD